ncbi:MAG: hypothetical protein IJ719_17555 [Clostridia bacterium]|nr:hypothetical protein [Clostridia bacterium]
MSTVTMEREDAKKIYELYQKCLEAERQFIQCQSASYRGFVSNTVRDKRVADAYARLNAAIEQPKAPETETAGKRSGRKKVQKEEETNEHSIIGAQELPEAVQEG